MDAAVNKHLSALRGNGDIRAYRCFVKQLVLAVDVVVFSRERELLF